MRNGFENEPLYPFAWLDELLEVKLNPDSILNEIILENEIKTFEKQAVAEISKIWLAAKTQTFYLYSSTKIKPIIEQYIIALNYLIRHAQNDCVSLSDSSANYIILNYIINLLQELIIRIEKRYARYLPNIKQNNPELNKTITSKIYKLICTLSADQIGIILKAADDTKLILAKSISSVFKTIIPYLSTSNKNDLSWDSVRSNSYHPEDSDKSIAINALKKLINKIQEY